MLVFVQRVKARKCSCDFSFTGNACMNPELRTLFSKFCSTCSTKSEYKDISITLTMRAIHTVALQRHVPKHSALAACVYIFSCGLQNRWPASCACTCKGKLANECVHVRVCVCLYTSDARQYVFLTATSTKGCSHRAHSKRMRALAGSPQQLTSTQRTASGTTLPRCISPRNAGASRSSR
jgi:hypothetical protein